MSNEEVITSFTLNDCLNTVYVIELDSVHPDYKGLKNLLEEWDLISLFPAFYESEVTLERLRFLSTKDIKDLIPKVGPWAEFRKRLFIWKKEKFDIDDSTISVGTKVFDWLLSYKSPATSASSLSLSNNLLDILQQTDKEKAVILSFFTNDIEL